jgi:hypothetical protein
MPSQPPPGQHAVQQGHATSLQSASKLVNLPFSMEPSQNGTAPDNWLLYMYSFVSAVNDNNDDGMIPVNRLSFRASSFRAVKAANDEGMRPVN